MIRSKGLFINEFETKMNELYLTTNEIDSIIQNDKYNEDL